MHEGLQGRIAGTVVLPGDDRYDEARAAWNLSFTHEPELVVEPTSATDVVEALAHARTHELTVAVQATGHAVTVPAESGSMLIVLSGLDAVAVDAAGETATVGGGASWGPVLSAAQESGLAPLLGSSTTVGAVGYTLGGGLGWLGRKYGMAIDRVLSFEVVLADGRVVEASQGSNPELFWGLCGAGPGSLGIVTQMEIELVPVTSVYAGNLLYPAEAADEVFAFHQEWASDLPDELTSAFNITNVPPLEEFPEPLRGRAFAMVRGCHCGDLGEGKELIDRWRRWREPDIDMFDRIPFAEIAFVSQDPVEPVPAISSGRWMAGVDDQVAAAMVDVVLGGEGPSPVLFAEARHAGGAIASGS